MSATSKRAPEPQRRAVLLDGLPETRVCRVVIDDDHFAIRVIELGQRVQGLFNHVRRFVVCGHVKRDAREMIGGSHDLNHTTPTKSADHIQDFVGARRKEQEGKCL